MKQVNNTTKNELPTLDGFKLTEFRGKFFVRKNEFDLNGMDVAEMTTNQPLEKQKELGELLAQAPRLYRENQELREMVLKLTEALEEIVNTKHEPGRSRPYVDKLLEVANKALQSANH